MKNIIVSDYDPKWVLEFNKIKEELSLALKDMFISIEHVGSTSVPGLCAKPIIDIDIVIDQNNLKDILEKLYLQGYNHVGDLGITGREAFKYNEKNHLMRHNLYVCDKEALELKRHIALRDYLRKNENYRHKYGRIKIEMAKRYPQDIDKYILGKEPVILEIYEKCGLDTSYKLKPKLNSL